MDFATPEDMALAARSTARYLKVFLSTFEDGVRGLGLDIVKREHYVDGEGRACPVLVIRGERLRLRLELRAALEEFLSAEGDARPLKVDTQLLLDSHARTKLAEVVAGRLEIVKALAESRSVEEAQMRLGTAGERFEWLRAIFEEKLR